MAVAVHPVVQRSVDALRGAVDELVTVDPGELSDRGLADELLARRRELDRQEADFARLAWAAHVRGIGSVDGAASTAAFLRHRAGMREGDARAAIECGEVTELLAETGRAWRAGEISTGAARTIVAARIDGHDDQLVAVEPRLLLCMPGAVTCAACGRRSPTSATSPAPTAPSPAITTGCISRRPSVGGPCSTGSSTASRPRPSPPPSTPTATHPPTATPAPPRNATPPRSSKRAGLRSPTSAMSARTPRMSR